jgi:hypothetical protein
VNESNPLVCLVLKLVQDRPVENKNGQDRISPFQRMVQACVIVQTEIPAKPKYTDWRSLL